MSATFNKAEFQAMAKKTLLNGRYADEWWSRQAKNLQDRFTVQMRLGMLQGESISDLVKRLRGTKAANFSDGLMQMQRYQAEALVRTSVIAISNAARLQSFIQNADIIKGVQWVSTLDSRTTEICIALDGKMWTLPESGDIENYAGYKPIGHDKNFPGPTAHFGCRSTQIAVMESFKDLAAQAAKKRGKTLGKSRFDEFFQQALLDQGFSEEEAAGIKANTRASMDGQVGTDGGYAKWLNGKDAAFQDELLGKTAGKLWRAGQIDLTDITNTDNRPLSSEALLAKVGG
jgi:SPP1 gp7 family putative phage head morphogenesis protein